LQTQDSKMLFMATIYISYC